ncbi:hypothetical protein [Rhodohalobacter barkolensis]|uniref:Sulfotransferase domain-containing protein n=1 Tax=Rhodohalobacter barkolensis TaxID=2053187 RepID=A0A2N0VKE5_9BACT|nr:hypothetical protein [Rhodohalobacter barkolensis]PKD44650.1 hypothetical protein CWD77_04085 [Rhodohalobacter barkolensis]
MISTKGSIERFIKKHEFTYDLYSKLRSLEYVKPEKHHELFITGFQRSGNTFAVNVIKEAFYDIKLVSHIHTISSLKSAIHCEIPTIVNFREPLNTIVSSVLRNLAITPDLNIQKLAYNEALRWEEYYKFCLIHLDKNINMADFSILTNDVQKYVKLCSSLTSKDFFKEQENLGNKVYERMSKRDNRRGGLKNVRSKEKDELISIHKRTILEVINQKRLLEVYTALKNNDRLAGY